MTNKEEQNKIQEMNSKVGLIRGFCVVQLLKCSVFTACLHAAGWQASSACWKSVALFFSTS